MESWRGTSLTFHYPESERIQDLKEKEHMNMKYRYSIYLSLVAAILLFGFYSPEELSPSADIDKSETLINTVIKSVKSNHYRPQVINDEFSQHVFDLYLERLDYNKRFFTKADVEAMNKYRLSLDDQLNTGSYEFFDLSVKLLEKRTAEVATYYKEVLEQPFDFKKDEEIEVDPENLEFVGDEKALKERWRKSLKYQVMTRIATDLDVQEKDTVKKEEPKSFEEIEKEAREKVLKNNNNWFDRMEKMDRNDRLSVYINCVTNANDPHTGYYPPMDKENFDIGMSGRLEGIGAQLQQKDGEIEVIRIVPGSPSYKQGELEKGDIIIKVAQGEEDAVDVTDMKLDDAVKIIRGPKGSEVRLTVRKKDDAITIIPIIRDVVVLEETYAKSAILEEDKKIGYIHLPKFYADFSKSGGRNCSEDVKKELEKLKKENVEGVILDLRDNGGGSLQDVVKMAGLFIESGPIVQIKSRVGDPYVMKDRDPGVFYDGPLVVMVNSFSASASEILAAAMQDYKRGVIIGSASTFGKGTVQQFLDLDSYLNSAYAEIKPLGAVKLTMRKFYRVNGGTTQLKGVVPDIILPDEFSYIDVGEKEHEYPMQWDEIKPANYDTWKGATASLNTLVEKSKQRTQGSKTFDMVRENAKRLKKRRDDTIESLNIETYRAEQKQIKEESKKYEDIRKEIEGLGVSSLAVDLPAIEADTTKKDIREKWLKGLKKDPYLFEAIQVVEDL